MSESQQIAELRRQCTLLREQLTMLEWKIEALEARRPPDDRAPLSARPVPVPQPAADHPVTPNDPDTLLEPFAAEPTDVHRSVRQGCFLYFAAALALVIGGVLALYFALRHK